MKLKKITLKVDPQREGQRLDQFLALMLPGVLKKPVSKGLARKLIVAGAVYLNQKRVRIASKELRARSTVDVYLDFEKLEHEPKLVKPTFIMNSDWVLYEDHDLIAINKPSGLPTQPTLDEARINLYALTKKYLAAREQKAEVYLGLHHRLDRDTSGIVLFTKTQRANQGISRIFTEHLLEKTYYALSLSQRATPVPRQWTQKNYLGISKESRKISKYCSVKSGGKFAHTEFKLLGQSGDLYWIEAKPVTGRTHQIRVHLSEDQLPIFGDLQYGNASSQILQISGKKSTRMMLHAVSLTFIHPILENKVTIRTRLPEDFIPWLQHLPPNVLREVLSL